MLLRALKYYFSERSRNTDNSDERDTTPDKNVCWEPYTGKWYEWARYETPFEYGLDDVYAVYESINEHELKITNYGTDKHGVQQKAHARAMRDGAGRLRVSFVPLLRFLSTPYHVLYVDDSYSHALVSDENGIKAGAEVANAKVTATVVKQDKAKKIIVFKYKAKKNERKKQGHRQPFTAVKVEKIEL